MTRSQAIDMLVKVAKVRAAEADRKAGHYENFNLDGATQQREYAAELREAVAAIGAGQDEFLAELNNLTADRDRILVALVNLADAIEDETSIDPETAFPRHWAAAQEAITTMLVTCPRCGEDVRPGVGHTCVEKIEATTGDPSQ